MRRERKDLNTTGFSAAQGADVCGTKPPGWRRVLPGCTGPASGGAASQTVRRWQRARVPHLSSVAIRAHSPSLQLNLWKVGDGDSREALFRQFRSFSEGVIYIVKHVVLMCMRLFLRTVHGL